MTCYRDRTYCVAKCANDQCSMRLTKDIERLAEVVKLPIAQCDLTETCELFKEVEE